MAVKKQLEVLWRAFTGRDAPRTVREMVDAFGGTKAAAEAIGMSQSTVQRWRREEDRAVPRTVSDAVATMGRAEAARAAGVSERTLRSWERKEERGQELGPRQLRRFEKIAESAQAAHRAAARPHGNIDRLHDAVLASAQARQAAIDPKRAKRIGETFARVTVKAKVIIDTGDRPDERWRNVELNFKGNVLQRSVGSWLAGGDAETVRGELNEAFGTAYAPGTDWKFGEITRMDIRTRKGPGGTFEMPPGM